MGPRAFILGHPVAHSRSPLLHGHWLASLGLAGAYERADVAPADLPGFFATLRDRGYVGGNVTVPHKVAAMALVSRVDAAGQAVGAINTVWLEDGALVGGNTDAPGFLRNLDEAVPGWDMPGGQAVVLGAGGGARAAIFGLLARGMDVMVLNRGRDRAEALAAQFGARVTVGEWGRLPPAALLANATPLGMVGKPALSLDLSALPPTAVVTDLVYTPLETPLLAAARARGLRVADGLGMLLHQAVPGFARWFGHTPAVTGALRALLEADIANAA